MIFLSLFSSFEIKCLYDKFKNLDNIGILVSESNHFISHFQNDVYLYLLFLDMVIFL